MHYITDSCQGIFRWKIETVSFVVGLKFREFKFSRKWEQHDSSSSIELELVDPAPGKFLELPMWFEMSFHGW
jgi:hypothetical protein